MKFPEKLYMIHIRNIYEEVSMGIVNIDDELHDQIRRASAVSGRSINALSLIHI